MADLCVAVVDIVAALGAAAGVGAATRRDTDLAVGAGRQLADVVGRDFVVFIIPLVEFAPMERVKEGLERGKRS